MSKAILGKIINKCDSFAPRLILITAFGILLHCEVSHFSRGAYGHAAMPLQVERSANQRQYLPAAALSPSSAEINGRGVVLSLVKSHLHTNNEIQYLTTALSPARLKSCIESEGLALKVTYFDGYSDAGGWKNIASCVHLQEPLEQVFSIGSPKESKKPVVVIDKIDDVSNHQDSLNLIRSLHKISADENVEQLIVYASADCMQENLMSSLCQIASATIHLQPAVPYRCKIVLKKPSGKVLQSYEEFNLGPDLTVQDNRTVEVEKHQAGETNDADAILAVQTTFNLTLTEDQRKSKNMLLLPHTRVQSSGGQIHYTPDDVDDWDEEDPDDDLDI